MVCAWLDEAVGDQPCPFSSSEGRVLVVNVRRLVSVVRNDAIRSVSDTTARPVSARLGRVRRIDVVVMGVVALTGVASFSLTDMTDIDFLRSRRPLIAETLGRENVTLFLFDVEDEVDAVRDGGNILSDGGVMLFATVWAVTAVVALGGGGIEKGGTGRTVMIELLDTLRPSVEVTRRLIMDSGGNAGRGVGTASWGARTRSPTGAILRCRTGAGEGSVSS